MVFLVAAALSTMTCLRPSPLRPDIVWIVVDTLRADHLEWYGYHRSTSPSLAGMISDGALFERAFSPQPETTPAIASMFTGLYPPKHGVTALYLKLHEDNITLAERLATVGYETAAFVSSFVMIRDFCGLDQGFSIYDDFVQEREAFRDNFERRAEGTIDLATKWVEGRDGAKPMFLFVHLIDPHGPYTPPGDWAARFHSDETLPVRGTIPAYQRIPGETNLNRYRDLYDGEVAYAMHEVGRLLEQLRARRLLDAAMVVITSDHGESLGERGLYFRHGDDVFQENVHVPLLVKLPSRLGARRGILHSSPVSHVDLLPTVLDLLQLDVGEQLDGQSLLPSLLGRGHDRGPVSMWARPRGEVSFAEATGNAKLMLRTYASGQRQFARYELEGDAAEAEPLALSTEEAARLAQRLDAWLANEPRFRVEGNILHESKRQEFVRGRLRQQEDEDLDRLRSLGYL